MATIATCEPATCDLLWLLEVAPVDAIAHHMQDKEERERRTREAQQRRQRWRQLSAEEKELDWQRYGKYDALQQLLQSAAEDPSFKVLLLPAVQGACVVCLDRCTALQHGTVLRAGCDGFYRWGWLLLRRSP